MKKSLILLLTLCISVSASAKGSGTTIQIIMDDTGVLIDPNSADQYKLALLGHLKRFTRKREFASAHIDVISSSIGRTIWSGAPSDLKRKPARALALVEGIKSKADNCNNLPASFAELQSNITALERRGYKRAHIIVFSSLIHTPRPCDETTQIVLPQEPPVEGNINGALASSEIVRSISFYWCSPHQKRIWEEFLTPAFDWAMSRGVSMILMDIERSKFSLQHGLELEASK